MITQREFTVIETFISLKCNLKVMTKRFQTRLLEEAFEFVEKQDLKVRKKILQNIRRVEQHNDPKFSKS